MIVITNQEVVSSDILPSTKLLTKYRMTAQQSTTYIKWLGLVDGLVDGKEYSVEFENC